MEQHQQIICRDADGIWSVMGRGNRLPDVLSGLLALACSPDAAQQACDDLNGLEAEAEIVAKQYGAANLADGQHVQLHTSHR